MTETTKLQNKIRGSLLGGAIGDALGYQVEFDLISKPAKITRYKNDNGIISDDTQMTLFTADALLWRETRFHVKGIAMLPPDAIHLALLDWLRTQQKTDNHQSISWLESIKELNIVRNPGATCISALSSDQRRSINEPLNDSYGCGGIMRIAPIGLYLNSNVAGKFSAETCAITHGHPTAIISAFILGQMICYLTNTNLNVEKAFRKATNDLKTWVTNGVVYGKLKNARRTNCIYREKYRNVIDLLEKAIKLASNNLDDLTNIAILGSGFTADEAFAIALYSTIKYSDSFEKAVVCAVNHDGDSDSTGAIAGNIIGAYLGYNKIPNYYKNHIELKNVILELADDLSASVPLNSSGEITDKTWLKKYVIISK